MTKILVMCHANQFRSPLATAVLKARSSAEIQTAGFRDGGRKCARKVREWLYAFKKAHPLDEYLYQSVQMIDNHRSTKATPEMIMWADVIVYMDGGNLKRMQDAFGSMLEGKTLHCLGEFCEPKRRRIEDPAFIGRGSEELNRVLSYIHGAAVNLARKYPK